MYTWSWFSSCFLSECWFIIASTSQPQDCSFDVRVKEYVHEMKEEMKHEMREEIQHELREEMKHEMQLEMQEQVDNILQERLPILLDGLPKPPPWYTARWYTSNWYTTLA
ncbi:hypothetical protein RDI58_010924 [Solanum bulbocastanum]|uniref:Uncharacterized protein n=1 Tax=Solanum bulbocastanum TaxID=147425 RepID=A0AAN8TW04_SOLBU